MEHALHLLLLLVVTRLFGELSERVGQPGSMGEMAAGIALALLAASPVAIPLVDSLPASPFLEIAADLGIFFLLLFAGIEMRPREIVGHSMGSLAVALGGVLLPLAAGFGLAWAFLPETEVCAGTPGWRRPVDLGGTRDGADLHEARIAACARRPHRDRGGDLR